MKLVASVTDPWVERYDTMKLRLRNIGIPGERLTDYYWLTHNLKDYTDSPEQTNRILKELFEIHQRY